MNEFTHKCMGTVFIFKFAETVDYKTLQSDFISATEILDEADTTFSLYKPDSEISRLARNDIEWESASKVQQEIREQVLQWQEVTNSFFTPYSPSGEYDPSGLVKTWATTNAAIYLEANGYRDFTINAGGDIYLGPELKTHPLNRVGLSNLKPISVKDAGVNMILDLKSTEYRGVATSGSSERGEHIWRNDSNTDNYLQVTVVANDLITADIWATAIISGGKSALDLFSEKLDSSKAVAIAISQEGLIDSTKGFANLLATL
jgi:FAD:protein FMN transferase